MAIAKGMVELRHLPPQGRPAIPPDEFGAQTRRIPLMYQTDVLEILDILTELGIKDSRMDEAVNLVISKRDDMDR